LAVNRFRNRCVQLRGRPQNAFQRIPHHSEAIAGDLDNFAHGTSAQAGCQSCPNVAFVTHYTHFHGSTVFGHYHLRNHSPVREIDELDALRRLMKAQMVRQVDIRQVGTHQLVFIVGRCQQYFIAYLFSLDVGPLARLYNTKIFSTHVIPERHRSAVHSLCETSWPLRFPVD
jgi:hypothetical protein